MNLLGQKITLRRILGMIAGVVIIGIGIAILILGWKGMLEGNFTHLYVYVFAWCSASSAISTTIRR